MDDRKRANQKPETELTPAVGRPETCQTETETELIPADVRPETSQPETANGMDDRKRVNPKPETELMPVNGRPETCQQETGNRIDTSRWTTGNVPTRNRKPNSHQQMDDQKRVNPKPETALPPADGRPEKYQPTETTGNVSTRNRKPN